MAEASKEKDLATGRPMQHTARKLCDFGAAPFILYLVLACSRSDPGASELRELERVEKKAERARLEAAATASVRRQNEAEEAELRAQRKAACKSLAEDTRACIAGKQCRQVTPGEMQLCAAYMRDEGLDKNPYAQE